MPKKDIFINAASNAVVDLKDTSGNPIAIEGILGVDISGALGTAKLTTYIKHSNADLGVWIPIADGTWPFTDTEVYSGNDGSIIPLNSHFVRFEITGATAGTSISLTANW